MAAAAIPIGASLLAPEAGAALGSALGATALTSAAPWLFPAVAGAGMGGIGGLITGQNPLKSALLGGLGGGIASNFGGGAGLGGLFGGGGSSSPEMVAQGFGGNADQLAQGFGNDATQVAASAPSAPSKLFGALPYFGLAGAALGLDRMNQPTQVGPTPQRHPTNPGPVSPLNRQEISVDPQSFLTSSGNRNFYAPYSMQPQFMAKGGMVRPPNVMGNPVHHMPQGLGGNILVNPNNQSPTPYPVIGKKKGVTRYFADGGSSSASSSNIPLMKGQGDGQSDSIPAMLSDGEFVMSAPAVSALGNGSNDAGAKKLSKIQKNIISRHYSGGKPKKALGLGGYVH